MAWVARPTRWIISSAPPAASRTSCGRPSAAGAAAAGWWARPNGSPAKPTLSFVVTSLTAERAQARALYEDIYCARGEMENRVKEAQGDLFGDRTSSRAMRSNQLRLKLLKIGATVTRSTRRVRLAMASGFPLQETFAIAHQRLAAAARA